MVVIWLRLLLNETLTKIFLGGIAGTHDPKYQTLAGMGGDCFGADKAAGVGGGAAPAPPGGGPKAPAVGGIAATHDPN